MVWLQSKIHIVLKGNADEIGDGILRLLGQVGFTLGLSEGDQGKG
jgi:hypothetical protein